MPNDTGTENAIVETSPHGAKSDGSGAAVAHDDAPADLSIASGFRVRVQNRPIDMPSEVLAFTRNPAVGAVSTFAGAVRNSGDQDDVVAVEVEHYPGMTEQSLWAIVEEATARWDLTAAAIVHRVGRIRVGEIVVLVVAASAHRADSFRACEFLTDSLKSDAPFWKKEISAGGHATWVEAKASDELAMSRWG